MGSEISKLILVKVFKSNCLKILLVKYCKLYICKSKQALNFV